MAPARRTGTADATRSRIIAATVDTLRTEGFAGTSARTIARRGRFNQALIFYHFGSVGDLLVAALEETAASRLSDYRASVRRVATLSSAIDVARRQYAADVAAGHITVLAELIAGASSMPSLAPELVRCLKPWFAFAEDTIGALTRGTPLERLVPARDAAAALVALYLGMELLEHLDPDAQLSIKLFRLAARVASVLEPLLGAGRQQPSAARSRRPQRVVITESSEVHRT
ncbi:MAG: TetR/AcrR family transcriptional regulator [Candidatus Dormibacteraeota bacterium]|nr:TetR/AcrR family transcriptional regulator [Candidatus Dormibacteraeota bacterium]